MFKIIAAVVVLAIAGVCIVAAGKPDTFSVQRSIVVSAQPEKIVPWIEDFNRWAAWSPYEKLDPQMKRTFSGAAHGEGAVYSWEGNSNVGVGRMEILDVDNANVKIKLDFLEPMATSNIAQFSLEPQGEATKVTWTMTAPAPYVSKVMQVFVNLDTMIGKDFESGLATLKTTVEK